MKILVLGSAGQLGDELMTQGRRRGLEMEGREARQVDVTDHPRLRETIAAIAPDVLVNATAYHVVPDCDRFPDKAFAVNAAAVQVMADVCRERDAGFVTFSTDYVFDGSKGEPYTEDDRPHPLQVYGVSKHAGEQLSALFHPAGLVIRTCGVYGGRSGSRAKQGNFVLSILRQSESKSEIEVSSEQFVNPTYAGDLAAATLELIARRPPGGLYHLAAEGHCSWAEFAAAIVAISGRSARIVPVDHGGRSGALRRPLFSALANHRARALGIVLPEWREGLRRYLATLALPTRS